MPKVVGVGQSVEGVPMFFLFLGYFCLLFFPNFSLFAVFFCFFFLYGTIGSDIGGLPTLS